MFEGMDTGQSRAENHSGAQGLRFDLLRGFPVKEISRWGLKGLAGAAVLGLAGLILGRAVLLGELFPFGPAAAAAVCAVYRRRSWPVLLGAALGLYLASDGWENVIRLISLFLVGLAVYSLPMQAAGLRFLLGSAVFAVLMVMGAAYVALTAPSNYEYIRVLFESVFGALLAVAFYNALVGLERLVRRKPVAAGELFSMVLALSCLVAAAGQLQWGSVSPGGIMAGLVVLVAGYLGGGGLGASAGAVMGLLPGLVYTVSPTAAGATAFAGLLGGVCRTLGRTGVAVGFLVGGVLLTVYLGSGRDILSVLSESALATLIFLLLPGALLSELRNYMSPVQPLDFVGAADEGGKGEPHLSRLKRWTGMFKEIAGACEQIGKVPPAEVNKTAARDLVTEVREIVCTGCPLWRLCWGKNFASTKSALEGLQEHLKLEAGIKPADLDEEFAERCSRVREMIVAVNCLYRVQKIKQRWTECRREGREWVSVHLRGISGVVEQMVKEAETEKEQWFRMTDYLKKELKRADLPVSELLLYPGAGGCEIEVTMPVCCGLKKCHYDVAPLLSRLTGQHLAPAFSECICLDDEHFCCFRLYPDLKHSVTLGFSRLPAVGNKVSGDQYAVVQLPGGRLVILLSDGMGSGTAAAAESGATLKLLQQLLRAGYGGEPAIRTVNLVMAQQGPEDSFATLDLLEINLYHGQVELIKIGAAPSFLMRGEQVDVVRSRSLPVGIVNEISIFSRREKLVDEDMLVMVTDGIIDAHRNGQENESWVAGVLEEIIDLPPGEVTDLLLKLACSGANGRALDDMTVLAVRLGKNSVL